MVAVHLRRLSARVIEVEFLWPDNAGYCIYEVDLRSQRIIHYTSFNTETKYTEHDMDAPISDVESLQSVLF